MGDIPLAMKDWDQVEQNPFFCPDPDKIDALDELMRGLKKRATPSVRKLPLWRTVFRQASASRSLIVWMPISPMR
jgi:chorismate synthase